MAVDAKTGQPIFGRYDVGLHNVGSYQSSGKPFMTGSSFADDTTCQMIEFPSVSKSFTVINTTSRVVLVLQQSQYPDFRAPKQSPPPLTLLWDFTTLLSAPAQA